MRSSIFYAAPLLAVAYAQTEEDNSVSTVSNSRNDLKSKL